MTDRDLERCENSGLRKLTCWCKSCRAQRKRREKRGGDPKRGERRDTQPTSTPTGMAL